ncbi:hypothetical protein CWE08_08180 [Aliidiomarina iranensis]|uniref:TIGR03545 family protein n=1 Tax=Aliidiomarina iranensis TaxID=1434071 RepID=A0A432VV81_9GAMM|nr:TIGR03545 family protein [Aliidiomarina iranensis]RUO20434.1 hypothetical protein CWE08_08180 [Aliidiomarina iranensis]
MKNIIRWPGLITFVVVVGLLALIIRTFAGPIVKSGLEFGLTRANGAEVNIASVDINWQPFAVRMEGIQFTNPEQPEQNRVQAESAAAELYFWDAVIGRIHITDLRMTGIAMGVTRDRPGKVRADYKAEREPRDWRQTLADLNIDIPSVDQILERSEIRTPILIEQIEENFRRQRSAVETAKENLPERETIDEYKARLEAITETRPRNLEDLARLRQDLESLRDDMRADRDAVRAFVDASEQAVEVIRTDLDELRAAPGQDIARVRSLISLEPDSLTEVSGILFGPVVEQWSNYAFMAFDFLGPMLSRSEEEVRPSRWEGRYIDFDRQQRPVFLIEQALTDIQFAGTHVGVEWQNLTWQHDRIGGVPSTYNLAASASEYWQSLNLDGRFTLSDLAGFAGSQSWQVRGVNLTEQPLFSQSEVAAELLGAVLNSQGEIGVEAGQLSGGGVLNLQEVAVQLQGENRWAEILGDVLAGITAFDLNVGVSGAMQAPSLSIRSDLDRQLQQGLTNALRAEADSKLGTLREDLNQRVQEATAQWDPRLQELVGELAGAREQNATIEDLFSVEPDDLQLGDILRDRLRESLFDRLGGN